MRLWTWVVLAVGSVWLLSRRASATPLPDAGQSPSSGSGAVWNGIASFYGPGYHGRQTANQETFDKWAMTAAHRTLKFNTKVRVTDLGNGRSVVVRINDRGPFAKNSSGEYSREIDLSEGAAAQIGLDIQRGLAPVRLEIVG